MDENFQFISIHFRLLGVGQFHPLRLASWSVDYSIGINDWIP